MLVLMSLIMRKSQNRRDCAVKVSNLFNHISNPFTASYPYDVIKAQQKLYVGLRSPGSNHFLLQFQSIQARVVGEQLGSDPSRTILLSIVLPFFFFFFFRFFQYVHFSLMKQLGKIKKKKNSSPGQLITTHSQVSYFGG